MVEFVFEIICDIVFDLLLEGLAGIIVSRKKPAVLRAVCAMAIVAAYLAIAGGLLYLAVAVEEVEMVCRILFFAFFLLVTGLFAKLCWNIKKRFSNADSPSKNNAGQP